ncbi:hypothetical protein KDL44_06895 [bacterium]|nr:hypothetical protein [bacterium]
MRMPGLHRILLLGSLLLAGCRTPASLEYTEPQLSGSRLSLGAHSNRPAELPLADRMDLVLLPAEAEAISGEFPDSTPYFSAIREAGGVYLGGDYLTDAGRESGDFEYGLDLPDGSKLPAGRAWILLLRLDDTTLAVERSIELQGWP